MVMGLADGCMRSQVWLPSLLGGLEGQVRGGLSDDQSACVTDALKAAPALVDGVVGDSLAVGGKSENSARLAELLKGCGVEVGR